MGHTLKEPKNVKETIQLYKKLDSQCTEAIRNGGDIELYEFRRFCRRAYRVLKKRFAGIA